MNFTNLYHPLGDALPVNSYDETLIREKKIDQIGKLIWYVDCYNVLDPIKFQCIILSVKELVFRGDIFIFKTKKSIVDEMLRHVFVSTAPHIIPLIRLPPIIKYETKSSLYYYARPYEEGAFFTLRSIFSEC